MSRWIVLCAAASLIASCDSASDGSKSGGGGSGDAKAAVSDAKTAAGDALGQLKSGTAKTAESVKEAAATAKEALKNLSDLNAPIDSGFSLEKLKGMIGSMSPDDLKGLADTLLGALQGKTDILKGYQEHVSKLGVADIAKGADLKKKIEGLVPTISGLKEKLTVVADKLKASGIDVSKYASLLSGS